MLAAGAVCSDVTWLLGSPDLTRNLFRNIDKDEHLKSMEVGNIMFVDRRYYIGLGPMHSDSSSGVCLHDPFSQHATVLVSGVTTVT